jgi:hypothetical protein
MNYQDILHFMFSHSEMLIGIFTALLLFTAIFVLILPKAIEKSSGDLTAIEEALKKVIDKVSQPVQNFGASTKASAGANILDDEDGYPKSNQEPEKKPSSANSFAVDAIKADVIEKEKKISLLESELGQVKAQITKMSVVAGLPDPDLQTKLIELQNKLSEYAIIEEELADISRFKEENAELRAQIEALLAGRASTGAPASVPAATPVASEEVPMTQNLIEDDQVLNAFQAAVDTQSAPKDTIATEVVTNIPVPDFLPIEKPDAASPASVEAFDESMSEPQASEGVVTKPAAPVAATPDRSDSPLEGQLDTSKMLQEMEGLDGSSEAEEVDPMAGLLDTEKLLAEVRELGGSKNSTSASSSAIGSQSEVDDLMGEFEAEQQQIKAKA